MKKAPDEYLSDEVRLTELAQYPDQLPDDPYWSEDLDEALRNGNHFIEPEDAVLYEDYRYVGAHNAFTYQRLYPTVRQQDQTIIGQLSFGVRGLMLDTYDWSRASSGVQSDGKLGSGSVVLAHGYDERNRVQKYNNKFQTLKYELRRVVEFMKVNSQAVITIVLEDYADKDVTAREIEDVIRDAGRAGRILFTPADLHAAPGGKFPTLGWMRKRDKRLVVFTQVAAETSATFNQFDHCYENHYGTSDEAALCTERTESAASPALDRKLVVFNHFPGPDQGSGVTPTTAMQKWRVEYSTAHDILIKARNLGFAGKRIFNGYWADRVIDCVNHIGEDGALSIFDYVNELNVGSHALVVTDKGYQVTSSSNSSFHLAMYDGSYAKAGAPAVLHRLVSADAGRSGCLMSGDQVHIRTTAAGAGANVFINAQNWKNLWYSDNAGTDELWTIERVHALNDGFLRVGEKVRFRSERQTKDAGAARYLSRESDDYLATRGQSDHAAENKGIVWTLG